MKTLMLCAVLCCCFSILSAQVPDTLPWCPPQASWVYRLFSTNSSLFIKIVYEKDTILKGRIVKKLNHYSVSYYSTNPILGKWESFISSGYEYVSNDSLYFYWPQEDSFLLKYTFNSAIGDSFRLFNPLGDTCYSNLINPDDTVQVTQIFQQSFQSQGLVFDVAVINDITAPSTWTIGWIINNIGSNTAPYPAIVFNPLVICADFWPKYEGGLVCYSDSLRGTVINYLSICQDVLATQRLPQEEQNGGMITAPQYLSAYPNPAYSQIQIDYSGESPLSYELYDAAGRYIQAGALSFNSLEINHLPSGMYHLRLKNEENLFYYAKFVKL